MMDVFEAAWVIARRDFTATVFSRSFILFLLAPLLMIGFVIFVDQMNDDDDGDRASQPVVALVSDSITIHQLEQTRERLSEGTSERTFPRLRGVAPAENVAVQARRLLADEESGYSAVFAGSLDRPVLIGPARIDEFVGTRMQLLVNEARRDASLTAAPPPAVPLAREITAQAAGNLQMLRRQLAGIGQGIIFGVTILLATLLLSNLVEEKSNKVIEVLSAAVPLDSVFYGKLIAMLGISAIGLGLWGGIFALSYLFLQVLQDFMTLPQVSPAVGWPAFAVLLLIYYCTNFMLLGALFLCVGGQATNIRDIQTITMPVTLIQVMVFLLGMTVIDREGDTLTWVAYILPFSSPLAMVAHAAKYEALWPHAAALAWQLLWVMLIVRLSARWFRMTVLKSSSAGAFFSFSRRPRPS